MKWSTLILVIIIAICGITPAWAFEKHANDSIWSQLKEAASKSELALGKVSQFDGTFLESLKITSPEFELDGVLGTTEFGGAEANVFLQKLGEQDGVKDWVVAFQLPETRLSSFAPAVGDTIADDLQLVSPVLVFSQTNARLTASDLTDRAREFYGQIFKDSSFQLEISDGVNLVTSAEARSGSAVDSKLRMIGIDIPQVLLHGVILKNFDADELKEARANGKLLEAMKKNSELRASIPQFKITALPRNCTTGQASLIVTGQPGVGIQFDMTMVSDGNQRDFECQLKFAKTDLGANKISITATAKGDQLWEDALGIKGVTLQSVELEISIDSQQKVGFGTRAKMKLGPRFVDVTGGAEFHAVTGAPLRGYFKGYLDRLTSGDLAAIANAATSHVGSGNVKGDDLPDFELRELEFMFAPLGGSEDLGITAGYSMKGDLYVKGSRFASCDAVIDQSTDDRVVMIKADVGDIELGDLALNKTKVDVKMSETDAYYRLQGFVKVFDAQRYAEVDVSAAHMYLKVDDRLAGVYETTFEYRADTSTHPTWYVKATFDNDLNGKLGRQLSSDIDDWADEKNREHQRSQRKLTGALNMVKKLDGDIEAARRQVQNERRQHQGQLASAQRKVSGAQQSIEKMRDEVKSSRAAKLTAVKSTLDSASSAMRSLKSKRDKANTAYKKAKTAYKNAKLKDKIKKKADQAKKKAAYEAAKGKYNTAKLAYDRAKSAYDTAAQAINRVPVDADPKVLAAKSGLKSAEIGLRSLQAGMDEVHRLPVDQTPQVKALIVARNSAVESLETVKRGMSIGSAGLQKGARWASWTSNNAEDIVSIRGIQFETKLAGMLQGSNVTLQVDARIAGKAEKVYIEIVAPKLNNEDLIEVLKDEIKRKIL